MFLIWIFATAVKITLLPLPAFKGHVPGINPESLRLAPWLKITDGTDAEQEHHGAGSALPVLQIPRAGSGFVASTRFNILGELGMYLSARLS